MSTLRMKYLWTPYMCILAGFAVGDYKTWKSLLCRLRINQDTVVSIPQGKSDLNGCKTCVQSYRCIFI